MADLPPARQLLADIAQSLGFFTRLPVTALPADRRSFGESVWAAPLAGLAVALVAWLVYVAAAWAGLYTGMTAALALAATMLATGCLHEDGLADVADGFGGGRDRQKKLDIMRDSRIGTYGVCALAITILLRWLALTALVTPGNLLIALVAAHMASRALLPAFMHLTPNARDDGLSAGAGEISMPAMQAALVLGVLALLPFGFGGTLLVALALALWFFALRRLALQQVGGRTGDVLGTLQQGAEIVVLLCACILFG